MQRVLALVSACVLSVPLFFGVFALLRDLVVIQKSVLHLVFAPVFSLQLLFRVLARLRSRRCSTERVALDVELSPKLSASLSCAGSVEKSPRFRIATVLTAGKY